MTGQTRNVNCANSEHSWFLVLVVVAVSDGVSHQSVSNPTSKCKRVESSAGFFFSDHQLDETRQDSDTSLRSRTWDRLPVEKAMHYELSDSEPWHVFSHRPFHITAYLGSSAQIADARAGTLTTTDTS